MTGEPNVGYAGDLTVEQAAERVRGGAVLVDIRSAQEWEQVGVPVTEDLGDPAVFVEWNDSGGSRNPHFLEEIAPLEGREIIFLCRSGRRSVAAAEYASAAGHTAYSVLGGFEAPGGWLDRELPWSKVQVRRST